MIDQHMTEPMPLELFEDGESWCYYLDGRPVKARDTLLRDKDDGI